MAKERRKRTRVDFHFNAVVLLDDRSIPVKCRNLSLQGMLCSSDQAFLEDQPCRVILKLTQEVAGEPVQPVQAEIQGRIVRSTAEETAIEFTLMDLDSFSHLKKLVEYHARDPEKINHELMTTAFFPSAKK